VDEQPSDDNRLAAWKRQMIILGGRDQRNPWNLGECWARGQAWSRERIAFVTHDPAYRGPPPATLHNYASVFRRFEHSRYRDTLSLGHHAEVMALPLDTAYDLLAEAARLKWSEARLRVAVKHAKAFVSPPAFEGGTVADLDQAIREGRRWGAILADPPWSDGLNETSYGARHYKTLDVDEIAALPVASLAADQAHLFLWSPNNMLPDALQVMEAWGFKHRGVRTWVKTGKPGTGFYFRNNTEQLLFGIRGPPLRFRDDNVASWFEAPRGCHSEKPALVHEMIEGTSPGPFLELYARRERPGWDVWGDQVSSEHFRIADSEAAE
jgi:N6-adenosine-specific RNA methylase IME4